MRVAARYATVAGFLALLLAGTWALRGWGTTPGPDAAESAVAGALRVAEQEIGTLEADLLRRAEALAQAPAVRLALHTGAPEAAVEQFAALRLPEGLTAELYTPTPELLAWHGPSLPLGPAVRATSFLATVQTNVATDGALRQGVVLWLPVRENGRVLGAIRMIRLVVARVPVRNTYLRDFDLAETWQAKASIPFEVRFGEATTRGASGATRHAVRGLDGTLLAVVEVPTPSPSVLQGAARRRLGGVTVFWAVLLAGWAVFGLGLGAEHLADRAARTHAGSTVRVWGAAGAMLVVALAGWVGLRYVLLALGVPARWLAGPGRLPGEGAGEIALFDPAYLASGVGGGVLGSVGDLVVTALFAVVAGVGWLRFAMRVLRWRRGAEALPPGLNVRWALGSLVAALLGVATIALLAVLLRHAVLDATLPYFDRTGPLPSGLILIVFGALLGLTLAATMTMTGLAVLVGTQGRRFLAGALTAALALALGYGLTDAGVGVSGWAAVLFFAAAGTGARLLEWRPDAWGGALSVRGTVVVALVVAALAYPVLFEAARDKQEARVEDAAEEFADGEDARVAFALEGVLLDARASSSVLDALRRRPPVPARLSLFDSLATDLVTGSLLAALADYTVSLSFLAPAGDTLGSYREVAPPGAPLARWGEAVRVEDPLSFFTLRRRYTADTAPGFVVEREPTARGKHRYAGVGPVRRTRDGAVLGWVTARAEPKPARYVSETPFPRVLVPAGLANVGEGDLAFAEFEGGVLVRTRGDDYGRFRLPASVASALRHSESVWSRDRLGGEPVRMYYRSEPGTSEPGTSEPGTSELGTARVVAVRVPGVAVFDHLYFYLRLLVPALLLALGAYGAAVAVRRRTAAAERRNRLRDRVLNRFLLVGVVSVVLTGLIGQEVVVTQNRQAVEERLKRRLARVEDALAAEAAGGDTLDSVSFYRLLDRARPDVVGPRLGLDVNLYRGADLVASSRSQLVRQRLIDRRLPIEVYRALYVDGERYAFAEEHIGTFAYTTGYEALPDTAGRPGAVVAIPTLPEQLAIESDQARMVAYLFGVLLLLLAGIFFTTTLLANDLTRPFRRLRAGLRAVGAGEDGEAIPVESRDEVGEVIETFNAMRSQLEESRRKLAQQERELAWREMARQVAHEIKNPLTPMKLSVQHLRRAHHESDGAEGTRDGRFSALLDRITGTLIEQIDALTRIANEFSSFARLPQRHPERLDLRDVVREAAVLLGEEAHAEIVLVLNPAPLPVVADREELRRVYINLLKNALQAMPETERGTITIRTERRDEGGAAWAWSAVRDTGPGIPESVQEKVFQPNFSTKTSGMGLGLAITKKAVEESGGTVRFETAPGLGTTFFVRLPLAEPAGPPHVSQEQVSQEWDD